MSSDEEHGDPAQHRDQCHRTGNFLRGNLLSILGIDVSEFEMIDDLQPILSLPLSGSWYSNSIVILSGPPISEAYSAWLCQR
jgi:hypothetical protein